MLRLRGVRAMEEEAAWRWLRLGIFLFCGVGKLPLA